jgi:hypothetical protein
VPYSDAKADVGLDLIHDVGADSGGQCLRGSASLAECHRLGLPRAAIVVARRSSASASSRR